MGRRFCDNVRQRSAQNDLPVSRSPTNEFVLSLSLSLSLCVCVCVCRPQDSRCSAYTTPSCCSRRDAMTCGTFLRSIDEHDQGAPSGAGDAIRDGPISAQIDSFSGFRFREQCTQISTSLHSSRIVTVYESKWLE